MALTHALQQGDAVGVGKAEVQPHCLRGEPGQLRQGLGAGAGECQIELVGEKALVGCAQRLLILDDQDAAAWCSSSHGANITAPVSGCRSPIRTGRRAWSAPGGTAAPRWRRADTRSAATRPPCAGSA